MQSQPVISLPPCTHTNTEVLVYIHNNNQKLSLCFFQIVKEQGLALDIKPNS